MKNKLSEFEMVELDSNELNQTSGGSPLLLLAEMVGMYLLTNVLANTDASYKAFMNGWNSVK